MLNMTRLEQAEALADLEPCWSGTLERAGMAPGLSSHVGPSSMALCAALGSPIDTLEAQPAPAARRERTPARSRDGVVIGLLTRGHSYGRISSACNVPISLVRSVARRHGLTWAARA